MKSWMLAAFFAQFLSASVAYAATCTHSGSLKIKSLDSYYCDSSDLSSCAGWKEVDLRTTTKPLRFMTVYALVRNTVTILDSAITSTTGAYTFSWEAGSCPGSIDVLPMFARVHESDASAANVVNPRIRFAVVVPPDGTTVMSHRIPGVAISAPYHYVYPNTNGVPGDPSFHTKVANIYYTMNSAISAVVQWSEGLNFTFSAPLANANYFKVRYAPDQETACAGCMSIDNFYVQFSGSQYNRGSLVRHELGHMVHASLHGFDQKDTCGFDYQYGASLDVDRRKHNVMSCEWGFEATLEGLATFFGTRSIVTADQNVWDCFCVENGNQEICSQMAARPDTKHSVEFPSSQRPCPGGVFTGIGDTFASRREHCIGVLSAAGQGCTPGCQDSSLGPLCWPCDDFTTRVIDKPDTPGADGVCDHFEDYGFRNEANITRFMWDLIDANNEGGQDDSQWPMVSLLAGFELMSCGTSSTDWGANGNCNEPNRAVASSCVPSAVYGPTPASGSTTGTRDSYNASDISSLFPGNQADERSVNCVNGAMD